MKSKILETIQTTKEFRVKFGLGIAEEPTILPKTNPLTLFGLMEEENKEYLTAIQDWCNSKKTQQDNEECLTEIADALGDMLYVLCGTILEHGMQYKIDEVFNEINRSNMSKLGTDGKPIYREDGKVMKGENYFKPNIKDILLDKQ